MEILVKSQSGIVLIDSRTGVSDMGSICTIQLPDTVVLVFAFNEQNVAGVESVARELSGENPAFSELGRRPGILLLPSRKDLGELERLRTWERRIADRFAPYLADGRIERRYADTLTYIREMAIPYVPYFAYGEEIAAEHETGIEIAEPLVSLARLLIEENE